MPVSNDRLVAWAAAFGREAAREFDRVVDALLALAWSKGVPSPDFRFADDPELDDGANAILRGLSDRLAALARARAEAVVMEAFQDDWDDEGFDADWASVDEDDDGLTLLWRFDMQGSHLKELLELWIALAVAAGVARSELRVLISRYLSNPFASPLWSKVPKRVLSWGRGYARNVLEQIRVLGQNVIAKVVRRAEWRRARMGGATYYVRRRGSNYDCDVCEDMAGVPIPIDVPFDVPHPRCMCYPEYHYGPMPEE